MSLLKSAGLIRVFLGLESFDEKQLKRYSKNITVRQNIKAIIILYNLKIDIIASVILADAHTSFLDLLKQFIFLYQLKQRYFNSNNCQISVNNKVEIHRGSKLYNEYRQKGMLITDNYLEGYNFKLKFWANARIKLFEIEKNITLLFLKIIKTFKNRRIHKDWQYV